MSKPGEELVREMIHFSRDVLKASAVIFAWAEPTDAQSGWVWSGAMAGLSASYVTHYHESAATDDPLRVPIVESSRCQIQRLADFRANACDRLKLARYESFLRSYGISDEIDLVLWDDDAPVAALGLYMTNGSTFERVDVQWSAVHRFMQHHLSFHPRIARRRECHELQRRGGLTDREVEVAQLVRSGASNAAIAEMLGISVATAKTHVGNILGKLDLQHRSQIGALVSGWSA